MHNNNFVKTFILLSQSQSHLFFEISDFFSFKIKLKQIFDISWALLKNYLCDLYISLYVTHSHYLHSIILIYYLHNLYIVFFSFNFFIYSKWKVKRNSEQNLSFFTFGLDFAARVYYFQLPSKQNVCRCKYNRMINVIADPWMCSGVVFVWWFQSTSYF